MSESGVEERIAAARLGDPQAFSDLTEPYRAELRVHCYRMLGSLEDAEDMVQDTFLRALKGLDRFTGGAYFRAWLYKIATNVCLDALDKRARRGLPPAAFHAADPRAPIAPAVAEPIWLEPFPDELLPDVAPDPEAHYSQRESISLAFLAALQRLPPRQRASLILCDVLDWHAADAAQLLEISVAAVNGLLRRARVTLSQKEHDDPPLRAVDDPIRALLNRYVQAWENGDVEGLVALLTEKVVFTMPPSPTWFAGREAVRVHAVRMFTGQAPHTWRLAPTRANNTVAFGSYRRDAGGLYRAHALQVLTLSGAQISEMNMFFLPQLFPRFGLASEISSDGQNT